ncbi:MAG TPA: hypothetical protein VF816_03660 [Rhodocyclaceae bacterium]
MDELAFVQDALVSAVAMPDKDARSQSRNFVTALARAFRDKFECPVGNSCFRVLSRDHGEHRPEFGLNELLFDVLVCEVGQVPRNPRPLTFVRRAIWQIESEFAADARKALFDFNKLVLGDATYKLFIGPKTADDKKFLDSLLPAALCCSGTVFVALAPHPKTWNPATHQPLHAEFWRADRDRDAWVPLPPPPRPTRLRQGGVGPI